MAKETYCTHKRDLQILPGIDRCGLNPTRVKVLFRTYVTYLRNNIHTYGLNPARVKVLFRTYVTYLRNNIHTYGLNLTRVKVLFRTYVATYGTIFILTVLIPPG
jgi:hypothetical protein